MYEPPLLFRALRHIENELDDTYHFIICRTNNDDEKRVFESLIMPDRKNVFIYLSDEFERTAPFIDRLFMVFRTCNVSHLYDNKKVFPIPLGYSSGSRFDFNNSTYVDAEKPKKSLVDREYDFFFSGQWAPVRDECINRLYYLKNHFNGFLKVTSRFGDGLPLDEYYKTMQNSKIAIVPHGAVLFESFRYCEAFESNNIVITSYPLYDQRYNHWYYHDSPAIVLHDWSELTVELMSGLLQKERLADFDKKNKEYFDTHLSYKAIGNYILNKVKNG